MIELRWVERYIPATIDCLQKVKVLQYRYQETEINGYARWSDWIDVPTQEENDNA